jgi:dihydrofolate reductase
VDITLLAAVAENGVIGRGNGLPWRLKSDMLHFREITMNKPVVMGRKTYLSIGKPLKGRTMIVVSRGPAFAAPGVLIAPNLEYALTAARGEALRRNAEAIFVAGGADIYAQALPMATRLVMTEVHKRVDGDAHFPALDRDVWREVARDEHAPAADDEVSFAFVVYERATEAAKRPSSAA